MSRVLKGLIGLAVAANIAFTIVLLLLKQTIESVGDEDSDALDLATIMEGRELVSRARSFRGGSVLTIAGGTALDLRNATLDRQGARLRVRSVMGGTAIAVPESWNVEVNASQMLGAVSNRTQNGTAASPTLIIDADALFGAIDIAHRPELTTGAMAASARNKIQEAVESAAI